VLLKFKIFASCAESEQEATERTENSEAFLCFLCCLLFKENYHPSAVSEGFELEAQFPPGFGCGSAAPGFLWPFLVGQKQRGGASDETLVT
jgi:hypothetical protein